MVKKIAVLGTGDANIDATEPPEPILNAAGPGFRPQLLNVPNAVFPGTPAARAQCVEAYADAGAGAAEDGFDALYVNTVGDYGLAELRRRVSVPVTGSGEAAIRFAQMLGRSFSIVTLWPPSLKFIYDDVLDDTGAAGACKGLHFLSKDGDLETLGADENPITQIQTCQPTSIAFVKEAVLRTLQEDGADTIILGCTCMAGMAAPLKAAGLPVVEPMAAGYLAAEMLLRVRD